MALPDAAATLTVKEVCKHVGVDRVVHAQGRRTQNAPKQMKMSDFDKHYAAKKHRAEYSVDVTGTTMDQLAHRPSIVDRLDWVTLAHKVDLQTTAAAKRYLKLQKCYLVAVGGSCTNFNVSVGGTSMWYHVLKGRKVFWLIKPTADNVELFKQWHIGGGSENVFFGDLVDECQRLVLEEGHTLMLPGGWIHAVFAPVDSSALSGKFAHSYGVAIQEKISDLELELDVPQKERFPMMHELKCSVLARFDRGRSPPSLMLCEREADGLRMLVDSLDASKRKRTGVQGVGDLAKLLAKCRTKLKHASIKRQEARCNNAGDSKLFQADLTQKESAAESSPLPMELGSELANERGDASVGEKRRAEETVSSLPSTTNKRRKSRGRGKCYAVKRGNRMTRTLCNNKKMKPAYKDCTNRSPTRNSAKHEITKSTGVPVSLENDVVVAAKAVDGRAPLTDGKDFKSAKADSKAAENVVKSADINNNYPEELIATESARQAAGGNSSTVGESSGGALYSELNNWVCEGASYDCKVFVASKRKMMMRKCCSAVVKRRKDGDVTTRIRFGETILVNSGSERPFFAKVTGLFEGSDKRGNKELMASIVRYYRGETVEKKLSRYWSKRTRKNCQTTLNGNKNGYYCYVTNASAWFTNAEELFASNHSGNISLNRIEGLFNLHSKAAYWRIRARLQAEETSNPNFKCPAVFLVDRESTQERSNLHFCYRSFDFRKLEIKDKL